ncbi:23S rRNA (uracil1939-C5)-methyltransferase [Lederbergia galactosidilyticus]|uniref:23S rRNA (uracil(1939)-C(5))-methyltransferase RlmD n=1 Tax=Lederbergia galactosidilytica TaxID=217031 RepID=UPI001AE10435|nr:23S rRNA (uracil(1939)-C(5))-methyltransferase RlmD [Lederbergia galactosidilytica]MBP1916583.1 23S rRNA (uracil1939-C5)-methyltransferase [Lederbergia galactosidilytica]
MNKGKLKVTCTALHESGKGIVNIKGKDYLVSNLLEGETATVEIIKTKHKTFVNVVKIEKESKHRVKPECLYYSECGGCQLQHMSHEAQDNFKQRLVENLLKSYGKVNDILPMKEPYYYRNKVHSTFAYNKKRKIISGIYQEDSHHVIDIDECMIHDRKADEIIDTIKEFMKSFKMQPFDEDTGRGFLRHILIKRGFATNQVMVVLVTSTKVFPGKNNFIKALVKAHPEISTIIMNINKRRTSVVLGNEETVLYGKGYIEDILCGVKFQISAKSFYQVNPIQTEILYNKGIEMAKLKGNETVIDAYCGIGTISLIVSDKVKKVIGVELNKDAVKDAIKNAKNNHIKNTYFYNDDAGDFMVKLANENKKMDLVIMDPPRSGSDEKFLSSLIKLSPKKVIYVSCNPVTLKRDLKYLTKNGYKVKEIQPVDMFPQTSHVECVVLLQRGTV